MKYILSLDQGTTSSRAIIFDQEARIIKKAQKEFKQIFPAPGWVEHDPEEILESQLEVAKRAISESKINPKDIVCMGITNQRETTIVWDKSDGKPLYNAIVWQDRRTASICEKLKNQGKADAIREKTGLVVDAYFSGTKIKWILDNVDGARKKADSGDLMFGTVDSWLIYKLSEGKVHCTDYSNASRTMLFNIHNLEWDRDLLEWLDIPLSMMPEVKDSSGIVATTETNLLGNRIPISGIAGDQQAALFGQACFEPGMAKNTYGTGCFMLMNTGNKAFQTDSGLLTTIAWSIGGKVEYALEGSVFNAGSVIQWLRDELKMIQNAGESEKLAFEVEDNGGVYLVPAFTGIGAPYWQMDAKGTLVGLTRASSRSHIVRAGLESIAFQTKEIFDLMESESPIRLKLLRADGGASSNTFLMKFQADLLDVTIQIPTTFETTALGVAYLAGIAMGIFDKNRITENWRVDNEYNPDMKKNYRENLYNHWLSAVKTCLTYK